MSSKKLLAAFQFRSFKRSSTFNPETGEETKIEEILDDEEQKKDLLDEILEKERVEDERRRKEMGDAVGAEAPADGEASTAEKEGSAEKKELTDEEFKNQPQKTLEEVVADDDKDEAGEPIVDQYDDLPLYQRLQKQAQEKLAEQEQASLVDSSVLEARMYIPQGLSNDDIQYFDSIRRANDTREQDAELNRRLQEKARHNIISLEERKRKREQLEELFVSGKKRKVVREEEVDLDNMIEIVEDGEGRSAGSGEASANAENEITSLFAGYTSE